MRSPALRSRAKPENPGWKVPLALINATLFFLSSVQVNLQTYIYSEDSYFDFAWSVKIFPMIFQKKKNLIRLVFYVPEEGTGDFFAIRSGCLMPLFLLVWTTHVKNNHDPHFYLWKITLHDESFTPLVSRDNSGRNIDLQVIPPPVCYACAFELRIDAIDAAKKRVHALLVQKLTVGNGHRFTDPGDLKLFWGTVAPTFVIGWEGCIISLILISTLQFWFSLFCV